MIKKFSFLAICFTLAACGNHPQEPATQPPHDVAKTEKPSKSHFSLPDGIEPSFSYKVRSKSVAAAPFGQVQKMVIEFKKTDAKTVDSELENMLVAKGFKRYRSEASNGALIGDYGKTGHRVTTTATPAENSKLKLAEDSAGTVYFVWH